MNIKTSDVKRTKLEYTTGSPIYKGYHHQTNAPDSDPHWWIVKYTYDGTDIVGIQESEGTWTARATLGW